MCERNYKLQVFSCFDYEIVFLLQCFTVLKKTCKNILTVHKKRKLTHV